MDPPAVRTPTPLTGQRSPSPRSPELPDDNWRAHQVPIYTPSPVTRKLQLSPWKARYLHNGGRHRDVIIKKRHDHKASKDDRKAERRALRIEPRRLWVSFSSTRDASCFAHCDSAVHGPRLPHPLLLDSLLSHSPIHRLLTRHAHALHPFAPLPRLHILLGYRRPHPTQPRHWTNYF
jgi:hypothetical protein